MIKASRRIHNLAKRANLTVDQLIEHYEIEKKLATKLRNSTREERLQQKLYTSVYDDLYRNVPYHSQLKEGLDSKGRGRQVAIDMRLLSRFLKPDSRFLEIGSGDCLLSLEVSRRVEKVYALDVSNEITKDVVFPKKC